MLGIITKFFDSNEKEINRLAPIVAQINSWEEKTKKLSDVAFPKKTKEFRERIEEGVPLTNILQGEEVIIKRIHEIAEANSELMAFLENKGIMPDMHAKVIERLPFNQTIMLEVKGQQVTLGFASAKYIFVERVS